MFIVRPQYTPSNCASHSSFEMWPSNHLFSFHPPVEAPVDSPKDESKKDGEEPNDKLTKKATESPSEAKDRVLYSNGSSQIVENDSEFQLSLDLPGVKKKDLFVGLDKGVLSINAERKSGKTTTAKVTRHFVIDEKAFDPKKLNAYLEDGILTITIGKKEPEPPIEVSVVTEDPPTLEDESTNKGLCLSLDLPGVKSEDLKVVFNNGDLLVQGERKGRANIHKVYAIKESVLDTSKLQAYLMNGVLTVTAPMKSDTPVATKKIPLTSAPGESEPKASKKARTEEAREPDAVVVETAADDDDEEDEE